MASLSSPSPPSPSLPASTSNSTAQGLLGSAAQLLGVIGLGAHGSGDDIQRPLLTTIVGASTIVAVFALFVHRLANPRLDPLEPPLLKPTVPVVGHVVSLIRQGGRYLESLRFSPSPDAQDQSATRPIATLPMLNGTTYVVWSPHLVQQAQRHKNLTFDELAFGFAGRVFGLAEEDIDRLRGEPDHEEHSPAALTMAAMKPAMMGQNLLQMNVRALDYAAVELNAVGDEGLKVDNVYMWLRELMTMATAEALYGHQNPVRDQPELIHHLWEFEANMQSLFPGVLPSVIARTAVANREVVSKALIKFYGEERDHADDVAAITRVRAQHTRDAGFDMERLGKQEVALTFVATTNTIPTLFWFFVNVFSRPELVDKLRAEVAPLVAVAENDTAVGSSHGDEDDEKSKTDAKRAFARKATLDIGTLETSCPLLVSCYRECIRLANQGLGNRYVKQDTILKDHDGTEYLLRKGMIAMWPVRSLHTAQEIWGADADSFVADRFVPAAQAVEGGSTYGLSPAEERVRKLAYIPFGGGRHLCPGRNFAFAENLGFMGSLVMGFDVDGLVGKCPPMGVSRIGEAVCKPRKEQMRGDVRLKRRQGWEDVEWAYKC